MTTRRRPGMLDQWAARRNIRRAKVSQEAESVLAKLLPGARHDAPPRQMTGLLEAYVKSPWVRAAISKVGVVVGSTPWRLFGWRGATGKFQKNDALQQSGVNTKALALGEVDVGDGELVPILDHPFMRLLTSSNGVFPGSVGMMQTQISIDLTGEAYWLLGPSDATETYVPEQYWIIPPTWVKRLPNADSDTYEIQSPYWHGDVPSRMLFRYSDPNPSDPYGRGRGHMGAMGDEIDTDEFASKHVRSWFFNRAVPDLLITGAGMSKEDAIRLEMGWMQKLRGFLKAHRPFFMNKDVEVHQLSQKFSDMELTDLRKWERDVIVHGLGMPPEILGILESSNRATIDAADYLFTRWVCTPRLDMLRAFMQWHLLPYYDDRLILGYESPVAENREFQLQVAKAAPWTLDSHQWARLGGWEPPESDPVFVVPYTLRVVDSLEDAKELNLATLGSPAESTARAATLPCGGDGEVAAHLPHGDAPPQLERDAAARAARLTDGKVRQVGGPNTGGLAGALSAGMQAEILTAFEELGGSIDLQALIAAIDQGDVNQALRLLTDLEIEAALEPARQTLRQALIVVGEAAAAELADYLGVSLSFELTNPAAVAELEAFGASMVTNVSDETIGALRDWLAHVYKDGLTGKEAAAEIRGLVGLTQRDIRTYIRVKDALIAEGLTGQALDDRLNAWVIGKIKYRGQLIADNELVYAGNRGQEMLWDEAARGGLLDPATTFREWIVTPDDRLCVLCAPMAGQQTTLSGIWDTGAGPVLTPNDIHVRCRCSERIIVRK